MMMLGKGEREKGGKDDEIYNSSFRLGKLSNTAFCSLGKWTKSAAAALITV